MGCSHQPPDTRTPLALLRHRPECQCCQSADHFIFDSPERFHLSSFCLFCTKMSITSYCLPDGEAILLPFVDDSYIEYMYTCLPFRYFHFCFTCGYCIELHRQVDATNGRLNVGLFGLVPNTDYLIKVRQSPVQASPSRLFAHPAFVIRSTRAKHSLWLATTSQALSLP